jgi:uncharacterized membrane protein YfcA
MFGQTVTTTLALFADPAFCVTACLAVACLGLSKSGFAGFGFLATPLLALVVPPVQAAAILLPIMLLQDLISAYAYRHTWDAWNVKVTVSGAVLGVGVAWLVAASFSDALVRLIVGLIALVFTLNHWLARKPAERGDRPHAASGVLWGAVSGFTGTLANAGGPPFLIHLLPQQLDKLMFVGTMAAYFVALNSIKLVPFFALGQFSPENLATSVALLPLAVATNVVGLWLVRRTPAELFFKLTYVLVLLIALGLIGQGVRAMLAP